ncbi:MAG: hypothetical protein H7X80_05225 [bacterium]|nr:hypothetical protein [Candidatus Kapabacteria bacterium]
MNSQTRVWNYVLVVVGVMLALVVGLGCGDAEQSDREIIIDSNAVTDSASGAVDVTTVNSARAARVDEMRRTAPPGLEECRIANHVTIALDTIMRWPALVIDGDDQCVLRILDSLAAGFNASGDGRYLQALDSCQSYSDGYVADAIGEIAGTLFTANPVRFVRYLHTQQPASGLESALVGNWTFRFGESPDSTKLKTRLLEQIRKELPSDSLTADERAYFENVLRSARLMQ